jgi:hypothetical protein
MDTRRQPIIAISVLAVASLIGGCTSATPTAFPTSAASALHTIPGTPTPESGTTTSSPGEPAPSATASSGPSTSPSATPEPVPPTSEQLIAGALASGRIDLSTSLRYRAFALYADPRLPAEYQSPVIDYEAGRRLSVDVAQNSDKLSPADMADITPFLARPNDPQSIFNQPPSAPVAARPDGALALAQTSAVTWVSEPAAGGKARVWAKDEPGAQTTLLSFAGAVVTPIWPKLLQFFRAPLPDDGKAGDAINLDTAVDIYLVDFDQVDPRSAFCAGAPAVEGCTVGADLGMSLSTEPRFDNKSSGYVLVKSTLDVDTWRATVAHELFHAAQDAFDNNESAWLNEATATWGEFRILHELGWTVDCHDCAHGYLNDFFDTFNEPLTTVDLKHEYGAYLYFYFAQMEKGDDIVFNTWGNAAAAGVQGEEALDQLLPFHENFPKYALRSWNAEPLKQRYRESRDPTFPDLQPPTFEGVVEADASVALPTVLQPLGIEYFHFEFPDDAARQVIFENTVAGQPDGAVQALVRLPDGWQEPADWTHRNKVTFCRDEPDQDIQELVVIISNGSTKNALSPQPDPVLTGKPGGCTNWAGTVTMTYTNNMSSPGFVQEIELNLSGTVTWQPDPQGIHDIEGSTVYLPVEGSMTWEEHGRFGTADLMCTITGGGTYPIRGPERYRFWASLEVATDPATGISHYFGHGLEPPDTDLGDIKMSCGAAIPPFEEDLAASWLDTGNSAALDGGIKESDANGGLTGTYISDSSNQGTGIQTWTWDFQPSP